MTQNCIQYLLDWFNAMLNFSADFLSEAVIRPSYFSEDFLELRGNPRFVVGVDC